eukprot:237420_1
MSIPNDLELDGKTLSFPYINKNIHTSPVNRLLVDVTESSNFYTVSLKYIVSEYYPVYNKYLQQHTNTLLQKEIYNYYNTIIITEVEYKYKIGQFGYITNGNNLEESFVVITDISDLKHELFFLHNEIEKYKFHRYDITSPTPKEILSYTFTSSEWIIESLFIPVAGTIEPNEEDALNHLIKLLNWKICREDYLLKKMNVIQLEYEYAEC